MTIAQTILGQLGGNQFLAMTGAKDLIDTGNGLQFGLPKFGELRINKVRIILEPSDTYSVEFGRLSGTKYTVVSSFDGIYADGLRELFERQTGLLTNL